MSPQEVIAVLDKVQAMTIDMLEFARQEDWVELAKLEGQRQDALINALADSEVEKNELIADKIQQILKIDSEMQELVVKARDEIRDEIIKLNKDKTAVQAYESK